MIKNNDGNATKRNSDFINKGTLCWNCKRACANKIDQCSWSNEFKPVKGWKAETIIIREGSCRPLPTYIIKECPEYIARDPFEGKIGKAIEFLTKHFNVTPVTIYKNLEKYINQWETETGKTFPAWVIWSQKDKKRS